MPVEERKKESSQGGFHEREVKKRHESFGFGKENRKVERRTQVYLGWSRFWIRGKEEVEGGAGLEDGLDKEESKEFP